MQVIINYWQCVSNITEIYVTWVSYPLIHVQHILIYVYSLYTSIFSLHFNQETSLRGHTMHLHQKVAFPFFIESCLDGKKTAGLIRPSFTYTIFLFHGLCCFFIPVLKLSYKQYMRIFPWTMFLFSFTSLPPVASSPFFMNTPKLLLHLYILVKQIYCYGVIFQKKFQTIKETWYLFMITTMTIVVINSKPMLITYIQLRCHNNIIWTSTHI